MTKTEVNSRHTLKWAVIGWLMEKPRTRILWSTHTHVNARTVFSEMLDLVNDMSFPVRKVYYQHGGECIALRDGSEIIFRARVSGTGRGYSADKVIVDESDCASDQHLAGLLPCVVQRNGEIIFSRRTDDAS